MRRILLVIVMGLLFAVPVLGQDEPDNLYLMYYENPRSDQLDWELWYRNICLEPIMRLNPDLDITDVEYGTPIWIPLDEPCYEGSQWNSTLNKTPRLKYYEQGQWLDEPYYADNVAYEYDSTIYEIATMFDVCVADLLAENILLQHYPAYEDFTVVTSMDIFIPQGAPSCDPPPKPEESQDKRVVVNTDNMRLSLDYFARELNICAEDVARLNRLDYMNQGDAFGFRVPDDALPCYNERGQRLSYYDANGEKLEEPVYSDLFVYVARQGDSIQAIAEQHNLCIVDVLLVNGYSAEFFQNDIEIFLPLPRDCPTDIQAVRTPSIRLEDTSKTLNICEDRLLALNPRLRHRDSIPSGEQPYNRLNSLADRGIQHWVIIPTDYTPCYQLYTAKQNQTYYEIEQELNICFEEISYPNGYEVRSYRVIRDGVIIHIPLDSPPCYNESGQRLFYPRGDTSQSPEYSDMEIYFVQRGDYAYQVARKFNVCVDDLLSVNRSIFTTVGYPAFIPDTRPCYDEATGLPLIYKDENGDLYEKPIVGENVMHYGHRPTQSTSVIYNVCANRIDDANRAKLNQESSYAGWIVPIDRPPCFDEYWNPIYYVCYTQPLDMSADYRGSDKIISFDYDGTHCYDLSKLDTVVWYENRPYRLLDYDHDWLLSSRAFTAWCYGVSLDDMDAINAEEDVLKLLHFHTRLIPEPTRDCYLDNPETLNGQTVHRVYQNETLSSIAQIYSVPYQFIGLANGLDANYTIWAGQDLIIPTIVTWRNLIALGGSVVGVIALFTLLLRRKRRIGGKKKKRTLD